MHNILICDDDKELCQLLEEYLVEHDIRLDAVHSGQDILKKIKGDFYYDLIILDVMLPDYNGLELLKKIKETNNIPIIMLSGRGEPLDKVFGLDLGADDYIGKPCLPRELLSRIQAILRRGNTVKNLQIMQYEDIHLNLKTNECSIKGMEISLTPIEFKILMVFIKNAEKTLTKSYLASEVWGREMANYERSLDMHVSNIRNKIGDEYKILGLRSQGYRLFKV